MAVVVDEAHFGPGDRASLGMELLVERIVDDARRHGRMFARPVAMIDGETLGLAALDQRCRNGRRADQILTERRERWEERRVGKECVRTCRSRWARDH